MYWEHRYMKMDIEGFEFKIFEEMVCRSAPLFPSPLNPTPSLHFSLKPSPTVWFPFAASRIPRAFWRKLGPKTVDYDR